MTALLEQITVVADRLGLPIAVGLHTDSPAPATYLVATPLSDTFDVYGDNQPGVEIEEVRLAVFTTGNYLTIRDRLTRVLLDAGLPSRPAGMSVLRPTPATTTTRSMWR